jgi:hypothetical protein
MRNNSDFSGALFNARLANVEYHQVPMTADFLKNLSSIIELLQPRSTSIPLIRIGGQGDGGYVISPTFDSKICLNLGVGDEISSDLDLLSQGFKIFAVDGTVPNPLPNQSNYVFTSKNIGYSEHSELNTDLQTIFSEHNELNDLDLILIDIEGCEYGVFQKEIGWIAKAKQCVVEFHGLDLIADNQFTEQFTGILRSISKTHAPIHVHANNSGGSLPIGGANWPTILEVTFLLNEFCDTEFNFGPFPTQLDHANVEVRPDVDLSPFFGDKRNYAILARTILNLD